MKKSTVWALLVGECILIAIVLVAIYTTKVRNEGVIADSNAVQEQLNVSGNKDEGGTSVDTAYNRDKLITYLLTAAKKKVEADKSISVNTSSRYYSESQIEYLKAVIELQKQQIEEEKKQTELLKSIIEKSQK